MRHQVVAMEPQEVLALLRAARAHSKRAHAMVLLSIRHGMRASEVTGLQLDQVSLKEGWIRIERLKGSLTTVQPLDRQPGQPLLDEVRVRGPGCGSGETTAPTSSSTRPMAVG